MDSLLTASGTWRFPETLGKHSPRTVTSQNLSSLQNQKSWSMFLAYQEQQARLASPLQFVWASDKKKKLKWENDPKLETITRTLGL